MHILVLGAYGLIGSAVCRALTVQGHTVTGLGRSVQFGAAILPQLEWVQADIATLRTVQDWLPFLEKVDAVVNTSGTLQDGWGDRVVATQDHAIRALIDACAAASVPRFVQISAPGADVGAETGFMRSKGIADRALSESSLDWTILRPGLVVSPAAYGGTSLLRALAATPLIQPMVLGRTRIQSIHVDDVAQAVCRAMDGAGVRGAFDLVEPDPLPLADVILAFRKWLGFGPPRAIVQVPRWIGRVLAALGDLAGFLGWRPALRSTALAVLRADVVGDPAPWADLTGQRFSTLPETLARLPSTLQERVFARWQLFLPLAVVALAGFWIVSGLVAMVDPNAAVAVLPPDMPPALAMSLVLGGSVVDIVLGCALLFRPAFRAGCWAGVAVCAVYLLLGTGLTPALWGDPLGPFVKIVPVALLMALVASLAERR